MAHKLGWSAYFMLKNKRAFDKISFWASQRWRGRISLTSNWNPRGCEHVPASNQGQENPCDSKRTADGWYDSITHDPLSVDWRSVSLLTINNASLTEFMCLRQIYTPQAYWSGSAPYPNLQLTGKVLSLSRLLIRTAWGHTIVSRSQKTLISLQLPDTRHYFLLCQEQSMRISHEVVEPQ